MVSPVGSSSTSNFEWQLEQNSAKQAGQEMQQGQQQVVQENNQEAQASGSDIQTTSP